MSTPSPRFRPWGLALLLALVALAVLRSHVGTQRDGFTIDEPWHVVAGVSYLRSGDYRLNPEHPPLVKLVVGAAQDEGFVLPPFAPLVEKSQEREWVEDVMFLQNDAAAAQAAQMHAWPRAAGGTRASSSALKVALRHQHGGWAWPVSRSISMAQRLSAPQSGQRVGSRVGAVAMGALWRADGRLQQAMLVSKRPSKPDPPQPTCAT